MNANPSDSQVYCQVSLSLAFLLAVWTPKFWGWTSSSAVLSQVVRGRPTGLLQSVGGLSPAAMTRWWSSSGAERAMSKEPQTEGLNPIGNWQAPDCLVESAWCMEFVKFSADARCWRHRDFVGSIIMCFIYFFVSRLRWKHEKKRGDITKLTANKHTLPWVYAVLPRRVGDWEVGINYLVKFELSSMQAYRRIGEGLRQIPDKLYCTNTMTICPRVCHTQQRMRIIRL